eukprot:1342487-Rhodomonas_salina.1
MLAYLLCRLSFPLCEVAYAATGLSALSSYDLATPCPVLTYGIAAQCELVAAEQQQQTAANQQETAEIRAKEAAKLQEIAEIRAKELEKQVEILTAAKEVTGPPLLPACYHATDLQPSLACYAMCGTSLCLSWYAFATRCPVLAEPMLAMSGAGREASGGEEGSCADHIP